jgi:hypothetical protein
VSTGLIYLLLGVAFLTSGLMLISLLKSNFGSFYQSQKKQLWAATIILSVTLLIRSLLDLLRFFDSSGLDDAINESDELNTIFAPLYESFFFLFSDLLPILAQLLSLIFGLIRQRQKNGALIDGGIPGNHQDIDVVSMSNASFLDDTSLKSSFFDPPVEDINPSLLLGKVNMRMSKQVVDKKKKNAKKDSKRAPENKQRV